VYRRAVVSPLLPAERRRRIVDVLRERGAVRVGDLVEDLGASEVTIRRDLASLERRGLLERTHGGAVVLGALPPAGALVAPERARAKRAIGGAAAALVRPGDAIYLNGGSTALEVFRHMSVAATVITNSVHIALEPADRDVDLLLLGGHVRPDPAECTVVGPFATDALRRTFATTAFLGVGGIDATAGITTSVAAEAEIARIMIERTRDRVVVVADSSKVGVVDDFQVADLSTVHLLVTDAGLSADVRSALDDAGLEVLVVE
jgi:DeoR/GlpR family transcriptional regulator of sugar metabolism